MIVLRVLGVVLCVLLLLAAALTIFTLLAPARIELKRVMPDGAPKMRLSFGPIHKVFRLDRRKKKPKTEQKAKRPKEEKPKEPKPPRVDLSRISYEEAFRLLLGLIDDLAGAITWEKLHVTLLLHTDDAARTGKLLGVCAAFAGNLYPYMERAFVLQDTRIVIDADFDAERTVWGMDLSMMTRLRRYPGIFWRRRRELWALWKSIRLTKEEQLAWSRAHTASARKDN